MSVSFAGILKKSLSIFRKLVYNISYLLDIRCPVSVSY